MSREQVSFPTWIWNDPEFGSMTTGGQRLYMALHTQPNLTSAGLLPLLPSRWARLAANTTIAEIWHAIREAESTGFVLVDEDTEEIVLRRLIPPAGHKQLQGALKASTLIQSTRLRQYSLDSLLAMGHDGHRLTGSERGGFSRMRLDVHQRDGYRCLRCAWAPEVPDDYDGRHALGEVSLDPTSGEYAVRILELDHVHPKSLGGKFLRSNLQTLCNRCNASKGARV